MGFLIWKNTRVHLTTQQLIQIHKVIKIQYHDKANDNVGIGKKGYPVLSGPGLKTNLLLIHN